MRDFVRPVAAALGITGLAVAISVGSAGNAMAQAKQQQMAPPAKQQAVPGESTLISWEDSKGHWHDEISGGQDRPETDVEG